MISIVVISHNEAPRLRLVLASLLRQGPALGDVVVVDDGSTDGTSAVIDEIASDLPLQRVFHPKARGRSAARNAGAARAKGDILLFLDGDTVAAPDLTERHLEAHGGGRPIVGRGETLHLRSTRFFLDPETGTPMPGQEQHVAQMGKERERSLVSRAEVLDAFDTFAKRASPGIYPGTGPRRMYELEMEALHHDPDSTVLWMAASANNLSLPRADFEAAGGFDERLTINEHRELVLRLCDRGLRVVPVPGRTYHLTHRVGWRDPWGDDRAWEDYFYERHPSLAVKLMSVYWRSVAGDAAIPPDARITSLRDLDRIVREGSSVDYDAVRSGHPALGPLPRPRD